MGIKNKINKQFKVLNQKSRTIALGLVTTLASAMPAYAQIQVPEKSPNQADTTFFVPSSDNIKESILERKKLYRIYGEIPLRCVDYQVDTLSTRDWAQGGLAYFSEKTNTITQNYVQNDSVWNFYANDLTTFVHEIKHRDNFYLGINNIYVSPEQLALLNIHNEISANIIELLLLRQEYIRTDDLRVFNRSPKFSFYKSALLYRQINPKSPYKEDFAQEMSLIINGTKDMWMEKYAQTYEPQLLHAALKYKDVTGVHAAEYNKNYKKMLSRIYTIGGVSFYPLLKNDVELNPKLKTRLSSMQVTPKDYEAALRNPSYAKILKPAPYRGEMSLTQYYQYLQHITLIRGYIGNNISNKFFIDTAFKLEITRSQDVTFQNQTAALRNLHDAKRENLTNFNQHQEKENISKELDKAVKYLSDNNLDEPQMSKDEFNKLIENLYIFEIPYTQTRLQDGTVLSVGGEVNLRPHIENPMFISNTTISYEQLKLHPNNNLSSIFKETSAKKSPKYAATGNSRHISQPLYMWIPDFTQPFIQQPTLSRPKEKYISLPTTPFCR